MRAVVLRSLTSEKKRIRKVEIAYSTFRSSGGDEAASGDSGADGVIEDATKLGSVKTRSVHDEEEANTATVPPVAGWTDDGRSSWQAQAVTVLDCNGSTLCMMEEKMSPWERRETLLGFLTLREKKKLGLDPFHSNSLTEP